jgi:hypothetical protein
MMMSRIRKEAAITIPPEDIMTGGPKSPKLAKAQL